MVFPAKAEKVEKTLNRSSTSNKITLQQKLRNGLERSKRTTFKLFCAKVLIGYIRKVLSKSYDREFQCQRLEIYNATSSLRAILDFTPGPQGTPSPLGGNLAPGGEICPLGECSPLRSPQG
jgi:hypothetical protein